MNRRIHEWLYHLLAGTCLLCGASSHRYLDLCTLCETELPWIVNACERCALPTPENQTICGACLTNPPPYRHSICLFSYSPPIDYLIHQFKYQNNLAVGRVLGSLLAMSVKLHYHPQMDLPEIMVPVPLHKRRLRERGFNQAVELGTVISDTLSIPVNNRLCRRIRDTPAQQSLKRKERTANIQDAFVLNNHPGVNHLALVDDVVTTGTTISELSRLLRRAGVPNIDVFALARTDFSRV